MSINIDDYKLQNVPNTIYYIPNFITEEEENHILKKVYEAPKPKWTCLKSRRLQDYGGIPRRNGMITEPIPEWLQFYMDKVSDLNVFQSVRANHVLINEYEPGQGIMAHFDGMLFFPVITTISCGSHTVLEFIEGSDGNRQPVCNLLLERRSLVILTNDFYKKYMHLIDERDSDVLDENCINLDKCADKYEVGTELKRQTRISLTIRNVPKLCKVNLFDMLMTGK
ncbi:2OG-Fe(II) oxygenase superfamily [Popillia japonica]|uniref:2OG-Fe(II) oxygenase superfamily n=1 Tax=Popillia japonica TaxID=7064 RepID=A0AAW1MY37_POPJA